MLFLVNIWWSQEIQIVESWCLINLIRRSHILWLIRLILYSYRIFNLLLYNINRIQYLTLISPLLKYPLNLSHLLLKTIFTLNPHFYLFSLLLGESPLAYVFSGQKFNNLVFFLIKLFPGFFIFEFINSIFDSFE